MYKIFTALISVYEFRILLNQINDKRKHLFYLTPIKFTIKINTKNFKMRMCLIINVLFVVSSL